MCIGDDGIIGEGAHGDGSNRLSMFTLRDVPATGGTIGAPRPMVRRAFPRLMPRACGDEPRKLDSCAACVCLL